MKVRMTCTVVVVKDIEIADELVARYRSADEDVAEKASDEFLTAMRDGSPGFEAWDDWDVEDEVYDFNVDA